MDVEEKYARRYEGRVPKKVARFYGMIENFDENVGRLLKSFDTLGVAENTLVILLTDNGTATGAQVFNAGMRGNKCTPYEGGTRVPCFWRWPKASTIRRRSGWIS